MNYLSLSIPGANGNPIPVKPPGSIPSGGITFTLNNALVVFLDLFIITAVILALFFLIWGGFDWMTSGGDKQKLASARQKITFAIVGLIIVFLAFFIINLISYFFGISTSGGGSNKKKAENIFKKETISVNLSSIRPTLLD